MIPSPIPIDVELLATIVHDIRNPLNVIGLTLRVIEQMPDHLRSEIQEDVDFLRDNAGQIEKMLSLLSDFCRLSELEDPGTPASFDPRRFIEEVLAERAHRGNDKAFPAIFTRDPSTPASVNLDPVRARIALLCALTNAAGASDCPLSVRTSGTADRLTIAIIVKKPPPSTVFARRVNPEQYERLIATQTERRGLDLAIASSISAQFGGSLHLDVAPNEGTTIVIDWPVNSA